MAGSFQYNKGVFFRSVFANQGTPRLGNVSGLGAREGEWCDLSDAGCGKKREVGSEGENVSDRHTNLRGMSVGAQRLLHRAADMITDSWRDGQVKSLSGEAQKLSGIPAETFALLFGDFL